MHVRGAHSLSGNNVLAVRHVASYGDMHRRALLAAMTAGLTPALGGCLDRGASILGADQPSTDKRSISLVEQDPSKLEVSIEANTQRQQVTAETTASLSVTLTNNGPRREFSVTEDSKCHLFNRTRGASRPKGLWLHDEGTHGFLLGRGDRHGERWSRDRRTDKTRTYATYMCNRYPLDTGESVSTRYYIWDDYQTDQYMALGTYRFAAPVGIWEENARDGTSFDWGFEVIVEALE